MNQQAHSPSTFPCPQCNAQLVWNPSTGKFACPFCGYSQVVAPQAAQAPQAAPGQTAPQAAAPSVEERDLFAFLTQASMQKSNGYGLAMKSVSCKNCGASVSVEPHIKAIECSFCGSSMIFEQPVDPTLISPESLVPLQVDKGSALGRYKVWLAKGWFHPGDLKKRASQARLYGVYLPFWTYDAKAHSDWKAEAGYYYYENESYWTTVNGRKVQQTRRVQKVRWQSARGHHDSFYDDVLIYATTSVDARLLEKIYPYDTKKLVPYDSRYLSGWGAEHYRIDIRQGWQMAQEKIHSMEYSACDKQVPGDTHRGLSISTNYDGVTFKHALLPLWISSYIYGHKTFRFLINGQTGKIHGQKPISAAKVALAVLAGVILLAIIIGLIYAFSG